MSLADARNRLSQTEITGLLGFFNLDQRSIVATIRQIQKNVRMLAAAASHQQVALEEFEKRLDSYVAAGTVEKLPLPPEPVRLRHRGPCNICRENWTEPVKRGPMNRCCPNCR